MNSKEHTFRRKVLAYYRAHGRHALPWRKTRNPYQILVSEVMLQQTQVERVVLKYTEFLKRFPTVYVLAEASLSEVLMVWQGLGYNRRAKMLHEAARVVVAEHKGVFPKEQKALQKLPGIGPYTASAVLIFAHNQARICIETNIRTVYLHEFFKEKDKVLDSELLPLIERTLDCTHPREWYAALMDYGTYLKKTTGNPSRRSKHHTIQKPFKGSIRETRGSVLRLVIEQPRTRSYIDTHAIGDMKRITVALEQLVAEGMLEKTGKCWAVVT